MALKLSMNQRSEDCAWVNAPAAIIRPPKDTFPVKIQGCGDQDGRDNGNPAEARGDPGETGVAVDYAARRRQHIAQMKLDAPLLIRLALGQGNVIDMFVDAHQRKPQIGFARVTFRIAADETAAHPVAQQGTGRRRKGWQPTP